VLLLLLIYVVLSALWKIDVYLISTLVNKSLLVLLLHNKSTVYWEQKHQHKFINRSIHSPVQG